MTSTTGTRPPASIIPSAQRRKSSTSWQGNNGQSRCGNSACASMVPLPSGLRPRKRLYRSNASVASSTMVFATLRGLDIREISGTCPMYSSRSDTNSDDAARYWGAKGTFGDRDRHPFRETFIKELPKQRPKFRERTSRRCAERIVRMSDIPSEQPVCADRQTFPRHPTDRCAHA